MPDILAAIRRYPVKSMAGESLQTVALEPRGLAGDRWFAVEDEDGRFASGKNTRRFRRRDAVFGYRAATTPDGVRVSTGDSTDSTGRTSWLAGDPALDAHLSAAMGVPVRVAPETAVAHFDDGAVSMVGSATLRWCETELGIDADPRRLRANLVLETEEPFVEEGWIGRDVRLGSATLRTASRIKRCRTIDVAQDGAAARTRWLKALADTRDLCLAVYADVVDPGVISVGDAIEMVGAEHAVAPTAPR